MMIIYYVWIIKMKKYNEDDDENLYELYKIVNLPRVGQCGYYCTGYSFDYEKYLLERDDETVYNFIKDHNYESSDDYESD